MRPRYLSSQAFSELLNLPNIQAFESERKNGNIPAPDTVFDKMPYWTFETAHGVFVEQVNAIRNAFGQPNVPTDFLGTGG